MVERITDPHKPVQVHGYGRLPDNDRVPQPAEYYPPRRGGVVTTIAVCALIVLALMGLGIAGAWS